MNLKKGMIRNVKNLSKLLRHFFAYNTLATLHSRDICILLTNQLGKSFLCKIGVLPCYPKHITNNFLWCHIRESRGNSYIQRDKVIFIKRVNIRYYTYRMQSLCKLRYINIIRNIKSYRSHILSSLIWCAFTGPNVCNRNSFEVFINIPYSNPMILHMGVICIFIQFIYKRIFLKCFKEPSISKSQVHFKFSKLLIAFIGKCNCIHINLLLYITYQKLISLSRRNCYACA